MSLEGHFCWENCDEGPHGCICGNDCPAPRATIDFMGQPAMNQKFNYYIGGN